MCRERGNINFLQWAPNICRSLDGFHDVLQYDKRNGNNCTYWKKVLGFFTDNTSKRIERKLNAALETKNFAQKIIAFSLVSNDSEVKKFLEDYKTRTVADKMRPVYTEIYFANRRNDFIIGTPLVLCTLCYLAIFIHAMFGADSFKSKVDIILISTCIILLVGTIVVILVLYYRAYRKSRSLSLRVAERADIN